MAPTIASIADGDPVPVMMLDGAGNHMAFVTDQERFGSDPGVDDVYVATLDLAAPIPTCAGLPATIVDSGVITGTGVNDVIVGSDGPDTISGGFGSDVICGRDGDDVLEGGQGDFSSYSNVFYFTGGADLVLPGGGDDLVYGDDSKPYPYAFSAVHTDVDTISFDDAGAGVTVDLGAGTATGEGTDAIVEIDNVHGSAFDDIVFGDANANEVDTVSGDDFIDGRGGDDTLNGGLGNDTVLGGPGADTLDGLDGDDILSGQAGDDTITGGTNNNGAPENDLCVQGSGSGVISNCENTKLPIRVSDRSIDEPVAGQSLIHFTASIPVPTDQPVTFTAQTTNGTAVAPGDYVTVTATEFTVPAGSLTVSVPVTVNDDALDEADETFNLLLSLPSSNATLTRLKAVATVVDTDSAPPVTTTDATSQFVPVTPKRIVDTRSGAPIQANQQRAFQITGALVPADATAVVLNVTATRSAANGFLQVFPTGRAVVGSSSTLNLDFAGQTIPNTAIAPIGDSGQVSVFATFTTDVLIDVFGYFIPAASATSGRLVPLTPTRILDTRQGIGWTPPAPPTTPPPPTGPTFPPGNPGNSKNCTDFATQAHAQAWFDFYFPLYGDVAKLDADGDGIACESLPLIESSELVSGGTTIPLQVAGRGGVPTAGVSAVVMNVTVANPTAPGFVQVAPTPVTKGKHSNLNPEPGRTIANLVVVPLGAGGKVDLYSELYTPGTLDLLADVVGYFTDSTAPSSTAGLFVPIGPTRNVDTRLPAPQSEIRSNGIINVDVSVIAPGASAIAGNLTSTGGSPDGFLQLAPTPVTPYASSSLNTSYENQTVANAVMSPVAAGGKAQVYTYGSTHILLDVTGWFTG